MREHRSPGSHRHKKCTLFSRLFFSLWISLVSYEKDCRQGGKWKNTVLGDADVEERSRCHCEKRLKIYLVPYFLGDKSIKLFWRMASNTVTPREQVKIYCYGGRGRKNPPPLGEGQETQTIRYHPYHWEKGEINDITSSLRPRRVHT